jgi:hypothetical protein
MTPPQPPPGPSAAPREPQQRKDSLEFDHPLWDGESGIVISDEDEDLAEEEGKGDTIPNPCAYLLDMLQSAIGCMLDICSFFQPECPAAADLKFAKLAYWTNTIPGLLNSVATRMKDFHHRSMENIALLMDGMIEFINDPGIGEASVENFYAFVKEPFIHHLPLPRGSVAWTEVLLSLFKRFMGELWVKLNRILCPCEFGIRGETMYLCMECMTEHF